MFKKLSENLKYFVRNDQGVTWLEYTLLVVVIVAIVGISSISLAGHIGSGTESTNTTIDNGYTDIESGVGSIVVP